MFTIQQALLGPTAVDAALMCRFTSAHDAPTLVVVAHNRLSVYRVVSNGGAGGDKATTFLSLVVECALHGKVAAAQAVKRGGAALSSAASITNNTDNVATGDYLILAFADAKMSMVEYEPTTRTVATVSMHYYEQEKFRQHLAFKLRAPVLRVDPGHRCAVMTFYHDQLAILPLWQGDVLAGGDDTAAAATAAGVVISATQIDERIKNIVDITFLHGYYEPTLAILYERERSWPGRLRDKRDTMGLAIVSLDLSQKIYPVIHSVDGLPMDAHTLSAVPKPIGGLLVLAVNSIMHFDQGTAGSGIAVNAFAKESTSFPLTDRRELTISLEAVKCAYWRGGGSGSGGTGEQVALLALNDGSLYRMCMRKSGRIVSDFRIERIGSVAVASSLVMLQSDLLFVGSRVGNAALYRYTDSSASVTSRREVAHGSSRLAKKPRMMSPKSSTLEQEDDELAFLTEDIVPAGASLVLVDSAKEEVSTEKSTTLCQPLILRDELVVVGPVADFAVGTQLPFPRSNDPGASDVERFGESHSLDIVAATGVREQSSISVVTKSIRPVVARSFPFGREKGIRDVFTVLCRSERVEDDVDFSEEQEGEGAATIAEDQHRFIIMTGQSSMNVGAGETLIMDAGEELRERRQGDFATRTETVAAGSFFRNRRVIQVTSTGVRLLNDRAELTQELKVFGGGSGAYSDDVGKRIVAATIRDPHMVLTVSDGSLVFIKGNPKKREVAVAEVASSVHDSSVVACHIFEDDSGIFASWKERQDRDKSAATRSASKIRNATTAKAAAPAKKRKQSVDALMDLDDDIYGDSSLDTNGEVKGDTAHVKESVVVDLGSKQKYPAKQWLLVCKANGYLEIYSLPRLDICFQCTTFGYGPSQINDSVHAQIAGASTKFTGSGISVTDVIAVQMGIQGCKTPYVVSLTEKADLAVYEAIPLHGKSIVDSNGKQLPGRLAIRFRRIEHSYIGRQLLPMTGMSGDTIINSGQGEIGAAHGYITPPPQSEDPGYDGPRPKKSLLVPFTGIHGLSRGTSRTSDEDAIEGVFVNGAKPLWIFCGRRNQLRLHEMRENDTVSCFAPFNNVNCENGFLFFNAKGDLKIATLDKRVTYDFETPVQQTLFNALSPSSYASSTFRDLAVAEGNTAKSLDATALADIPSTILKVTFHPDSQQYCVVTAIDTPFFIRRDDAIPEDENGFRIQDEEDVELERKKREGEAEVIEILPGKFLPRTRRFALEIVSPLTWGSVDKYSFSQDEHALTVMTCTLDVKVSSIVQKKQFIVVGTGFIKGEDVTCRGKVYIFEIIDVVPEPGRPETNHKLKMVKAEELRGPVSAVCALDGNLAVNYGTKLMVYSFEDGEKLTGIAFLDVNFYAMTMRAAQRFLVLGDVQKSVLFLGYQDDPTKLVVLGRDYDDNTVLDANFLLDDGAMGFLVADSNENFQVLQYSPTHIASFNGQKLLRKGDYHIGSNVLRLVRVNKRPYRRPNAPEATVPRQQGCIYATVNGEIGFVLPVEEKAYKRMHDIYTEMVNRLEHPAGLNPRAYRLYRIPPRFGSHPVKNVLDGDYLLKYSCVSSVERMKWARNKGTSDDRVLDDLVELAATTAFF